MIVDAEAAWMKERAHVFVKIARCRKRLLFRH